MLWPDIDVLRTPLSLKIGILETGVCALLSLFIYISGQLMLYNGVFPIKFKKKRFILKNSEKVQFKKKISFQRLDLKLFFYPWSLIN